MAEKSTDPSVELDRSGSLSDDDIDTVAGGAGGDIKPPTLEEPSDGG